VSASNLNRHLGPVMTVVASTVGLLMQQSETAGALPSLFAATRNPPGAGYVGHDRRGEKRGNHALAGRSARAADPGRARELWAACEQPTGVRLPLPTEA
jgi:hypothetical protein